MHDFSFHLSTARALALEHIADISKGFDWRGERMKRGTTKTLRAEGILLILFLLCVFTALTQPVRAQTVTATIPVGSQPSSVAVTPNGAYVYVANSESPVLFGEGNIGYGPGTVSVISTATNTVTATVTVGSFPRDVAVTPNGKYSYVTDSYYNVTNFESGTVSVISTATNTVTATVSVGSYPVGVAVTPNSEYAYVVNSVSNSVSVINTATNTVTTTVPVGSTPEGVAVTPNGAYVYVTNQGGGVSVISTATNTVTATVTVGSNPWGVAVTPNGAYAYVTNFESGTVSVISTTTNTVTATVTVGNEPEGVAVTPNGEYAYVTDEYGVSVINTATNEVTGTIPVGYVPSGVSPYAVGVSPNGDYAYVTNDVGPFTPGSVSVISTPTSAVSVSPFFWTMDVGQSETFTAAASGGSGNYTGYQWFVNGFAQAGQTLSTFSFVPASAGIYSISATVNGSSGGTLAPFYAAAVTVNALLTVSIAPVGPLTLHVAKVQTFNATASGGSGNYTSYQWYVNGAAQSGASASTFNYTAASSGTYKITATVTDSLGATSAHSTAAAVTVPSLFSTVDWIVVIVIIIALLFIILAWYRRRRKKKTQQTQTT